MSGSCAAENEDGSIWQSICLSIVISAADLGASLKQPVFQAAPPPWHDVTTAFERKMIAKVCIPSQAINCRPYLVSAGKNGGLQDDWQNPKWCRSAPDPKGASGQVINKHV